MSSSTALKRLCDQNWGM